MSLISGSDQPSRAKGLSRRSQLERPHRLLLPRAPLGRWGHPAPPYSSGRKLSAFLESGPAPFYAGFGSMISRDPEALAPAVVEAAQQAGVRLILSPGWGRVVPRAAVALDPVVAPAAGLPCGDWLC